VLVQLAKIGLTLTLFFIGAGLLAKVVRAVGARPYALGVLLQVVVFSVSLYAILHIT
jgi:Kef-type K+ transport system membrane component KefB